MNTILNRRNNIITHKMDELKSKPYIYEKMILPLSLRRADGSWWQFPIEPLITISGANKIIKRNVAKATKRGTIKERWAEDDIKVSIQGSFVHPDKKTYPSDDVTNLSNIIAQKTVIEVQNELLQLLNISQIVIESYQLPFSKGENVQNYLIDAISDDSYDLFIAVENV